MQFADSLNVNIGEKMSIHLGYELGTGQAVEIPLGSLRSSAGVGKTPAKPTYTPISRSW